MGSILGLQSLVVLVKEHGMAAVLLIVAVFILLNSKFTLQYPRSSKKAEDEFKE